MQGTIKFYNFGRAFGFVTSNDDNKDYFFHVTNVAGELPRAGGKCRFELAPGKKGVEAVKVVTIST